jgi:hypothetical protein
MSKKKEPVCPYIGKPCLGDGCTMWVHILGENPQTRQPMDLWDCSIKWMPVLFLENAKGLRGVQAATESMRNEVVQRQDVLNGALDRAYKLANNRAERPDSLLTGE